jgi:hypothetical protein
MLLANDFDEDDRLLLARSLPAPDEAFDECLDDVKELV